MLYSKDDFDAMNRKLLQAHAINQNLSMRNQDLIVKDNLVKNKMKILRKDLINQQRDLENKRNLYLSVKNNLGASQAAAKIEIIKQVLSSVSEVLFIIENEKTN